MKQTHAALFLVLVILSACKHPVLVLKARGGSIRFRQGEAVGPLLQSENIDFSNCDSIPVFFWEIDSIFSDRISFKKDLSFVNDTLDASKLKQLKKEDKAKFDYYKAYWIDSYIDTQNNLYRISRVPTETFRFYVPFDSLAGLAIQNSFTECDGYFKSFLLSFSNKRDQVFRYNFENMKIQVRNGN